MSDEQNSWTLNDSARASNPGRVKVNFLRWFQYNPIEPLCWFVALLGFVLLAWFVHWGFWVAVVIFGSFNFVYWMEVRERFLYGCANPAVIVSMDPMLIAVASDLAKSFTSYPVIKIAQKRVPTAWNKPPALGSPLPMVSLYHGDPKNELPHWEDITPEPVECATGEGTLQTNSTRLLHSESHARGGQFFMKLLFSSPRNEKPAPRTETSRFAAPYLGISI
jgi:hypothetical protein